MNGYKSSGQKKNTVWPYVIDHHLVSIASPQNKKKKDIYPSQRVKKPMGGLPTHLVYSL